MVKFNVLVNFTPFNGRENEFMIFLENNRGVKKISSIANWTECWCDEFNFIVETEHETEGGFIALYRGLSEVFKGVKLIPLKIMSDTEVALV